MKIFKIVSLLAMLLFIFACKSLQRVQTPETVNHQPVDSTSWLPFLQKDSIVYWAARAKVAYNANGKTQNLKANFRIKKDSIIWVSITPEIAILEALRVRLTPQEITIVNFLNKEYYQEDFEFVQRFLKMKIEFSELQQVLMQQLDYLYPQTLYKSFIANRDSIQVMGDFKIYNEEFKRSKTFYEDMHYTKIAQQKMVQSLWYKPSNNAQLNVNLKLPEKTESGIIYFKEAQIDIVSPDKETIVQFIYSNVRVNEVLEFPLTIPESYYRMSILLD